MTTPLWSVAGGATASPVASGELLIDCQEDLTLRAVLVGMLTGLT